ncbi:efflux RND transporter periplasmic adaptor subunit [Putridiphycobacter roseus]|uniref:Efflux RND transporter periplasmic adaptor subunit n=1 Tax=Putridiphycobacter roseus TaxID=2219161 RepID=A0A2W1NM04_9FLAO|nr:efflux RND transporter periplasmic adaptor subunit [Putridiphycobacter roseus]PZE18876.1 efflux RND transporter periplasmic adaptor subunit [Putridiphycobacter roseus]
MKNNKLIIGALVGIVLAILIYFIFFRTEITVKHDDHEGHDHAAESHEASTEKEVTLSAAQFDLIKIEMGDFVQKNMSDVLSVNGYTKLPPHNQAAVSSPISGLINSIKVIEGQYVKKGQLLGTIESLEIAKMQEAYLSSKSKVTYLKLEFDRQEKLQAENVNAQKVFQKVQSDLAIEEAKYNSLKQQLNMLNINPNSPVSTRLPILSPITGNITEVNIKIGSSVAPGNELFSIVDNDEMHIDLMVYEKDLGKVEKGQHVRFVLTNQSNTEINGTIFNVGKSFENETKTVAVHADIDETEVQLIPGMYINALIDIGSEKVNTLPASAIIDDVGRKFIYVLEGKGELQNGHGHETTTNSDHHPQHKTNAKSHAAHGTETSHHDHEHAPTSKAGHHVGHDTKATTDHGHDHTKSDYVFRRVEVKIGAEQLGSVGVTPIGMIGADEKIVIQGAYYLQSHLQKSEGGGGHSH